ncbi:MAG: autotransporter-associated beta strand repeat-containing protein, partial [Planctomycetota bacterium]
ANTLAIAAGSNVGSGTAGVTFGATTLTGNATFNTGSGSLLTLAAMGGAFNVTKTGSGTLALSAGSSYTGTTTIAAGVLRTTAANAITAGNDVVFSGSSTLDLQQNQTLGNLVINSAAAGAAVTNSTATSRTLAIDTLTVNDNATVGGTSLSLTQSTNVGTDTWSIAAGKTLALSSTAAFASAASRGAYVNIANSGTINSAIATTNGIVGGGWLTYGAVGSNNDWATVASGTLVALGTGGSSYDTIASPGTNRNVLADTSGSVASGTWNSIKVTAATSGQSLTISSGTLALAAGGIIFTGSNDYAINGSTLTSKQGATNSDLIVYQNGSGNLTIGSTIGNGNGAQTLTKFGSGKLTLGGSIAYTGATYLSGGTLAYTADNANVKAIQYGLFQGDTTPSTLDIQSNVTATGLTVSVVGSGTSGLNIASGKTFTVAGNVQIGGIGGTFTSGSTPFVAQGSGTFAMNSTGGSFTVSGGATNANAIADFSSLGSMVINTGTTGVGNVQIAANGGNLQTNDVLYLASLTSLTTPTLNIGNSVGGGSAMLYLGTGTNTINANTINIVQTPGGSVRTSVGVMT